jgi:2-dehydro-3-deoxygalactonokinase
MRMAEGFIAVDWGTTNRRAYRIDGDGRCGEEFEDDRGVLSVADGDFGGAVAEIRSRLGDRALLLAGMIGSNRGWIEAPYVPCPAGVEEVAGALVWPDEQTAIVPGVCDPRRADVMRGEEVQLLGAIAEGSVPADALVCHPGTHNKWVEVAGGRIATFRTIMTGELFNLLREHSVLSDLLAEPAEPGDAFDSGVRDGLSGDVQAQLFSVRARVLLGKARREDAPAYTSGLLIGGDVRIGLESAAPATQIVIMGRPELTRLYASAVAIAGREPVELDGERCFVAGIRQIAERIQ